MLPDLKGRLGLREGMGVALINQLSTLCYKTKVEDELNAKKSTFG